MPILLDPHTLSELPLFHDLPHDQLSKLSGLLHRKTFPPKSNLMMAEQPGEAAYIILTGSVKIHIEQADGTDVILGILGAGEIVGELSLVDSISRSATVVTLEESNVLWLDRATFQDCLLTMPIMAHNLAVILARRLRLANAQIQSLAAQDVWGRVARQILAFAEAYGKPTTTGDILIPLRLTQSDIAGLVGASRVRVNQILVFYKQRKYISIDQNCRIIVHNAAALAQRCQ
jgi:CRP/FNR family cyclic AMP-dependent transcriptional regulator